MHQCWASRSVSPGPPSSLANTQMQESGCPQHPEASTPRRQRRAGEEGQGSAVRSACRQHTALLPRHRVPVGAGPPARRSGVVLFTSPVDVLEEGHGEGHAQDLKDKGKGSDGSPAPGARHAPPMASNTATGALGKR